MKFFLIFACAFLNAALFTDSSLAEEKIFNDWFATCDNVHNCSAFAITERNEIPHHIRIDRNGDPKALPHIEVIVFIDKGKRFGLVFDDLTTVGLPKDRLVGTASPIEDDDALEPDEDGATTVEITEIEPFLAKLHRASSLKIVLLDAPAQATPAEISLVGATAALLWIDERQHRLDTVTAMLKRGKKPVSAVPPPPLLPRVKALKPSIKPIPKKFPPIIAAKISEACKDERTGDEDTYGAEVGEIAPLSGNLLLYSFECHNLSGAYNPWTAFMIAPRGRPSAARFAQLPLPPTEKNNIKPTTHQAVYASFNPKTQTLHSLVMFRGIGDCGITYDWVWDGNAFQLVEYRSMPVCGMGLIPKRWPIEYQASQH